MNEYKKDKSYFTFKYQYFMIISMISNFDNLILDHLTSFALLLGGTNGSGGCGSNDNDFVIVYISIGLIVFAILIVIISVGINELSYRIKNRKKQSLMRIIQGSTPDTIAN